MEKYPELNEFQTPIEDLHLEKEPQEIQEQFLDLFYNVPFIQNLTSIDRKRAKDLPRDDKGRIIVDVTHPHILEDMDYFRPAAIYFQKNGCYTKLRPNSNPNSEYGKWCLEEARRCREGYVRESDGEWIPGDYYFFLNYCPMQLVKKEDKKSKKGKRVFDFPKVWEGHYLKAHALQQARDQGHHYAELASRSKGKSFYAAAMLAKRFVLGESKEVNKKVVSYITADDRKYLTGGDQTLDKFQFDVDWIANNMQWPSKRLINSLSNMQWIMGYKDIDSGTNQGTLNSVIGVTSKDDPQKLRGTRGVLYVIEEMGCHVKGTEVLMYDGSIKKVEDIKIGDVLMGNDNTPRTVQFCHNGVDQLYKITLSNGDYQIVNSKHPVYFKKYDWNKRQYSEHLLTAPELMQIKDLNKGYYIPKAVIKFPHKDVCIDPYFLGLWLGGGDSSRLDISNEDFEVLDWLKSNYNGIVKDLKQSATCKNFHIRKTDCVYNDYFKELNLYNNKHVPIDYKINSSEIQLQVVAGLIDTDGTYSKKKNFFEITQRFDRKHILDDIKFMCECNGLKCKMSSRIGTGLKKGVLHYRLRISGDLSIIPTKIERKKGIKNKAYRSRNVWSDYTFKVEPFGLGEFYGFTVDKNHLFVLSDLTITHNTFPALLDLIGNLRPSVEEGEDVFGIIIAYGTSSDKESDFTSAQEIVYNPEGYNFIAFDNVYDKLGQGKRKFAFFFPGYLNMANYYEETNGISDVTGALFAILKDRYWTKYHVSNPAALTKRIAEIPVTPQEAMLRTRGNIFPVTQLNDRLNELDNNPNSLDDVYVGRLVQDNTGTVKFVPTDDTPIRDFPTKDNKEKGAIEIFEMPQKDSRGNVFQGRYILGHDPVDSDAADTMSLTSTFVLDLFTDRIVAEYTGRQDFADDNFEIVRLLCLFYNGKCLFESNKKGIFAYFSTRRCLHLLADTPEYLKDKQIIKEIGYGNNSKGVNATKPVNDYANALLRDWFLKPVPIVKKDENGNEYETTVPNLAFVKNRALLKEAVMFNPEINVDRIRAMGMVMLYRGQYIDLYEGDMSRAVEEVEDPAWEDAYFKAYDEK